MKLMAMRRVRHSEPTSRSQTDRETRKFSKYRLDEVTVSLASKPQTPTGLDSKAQGQQREARATLGMVAKVRRTPTGFNTLLKMSCSQKLFSLQTIVIGALLWTLPAWAQNPGKVGQELFLNQTTESYQEYPEVVLHDDDSFTAVWNDSGLEGVIVRRFDAEGQPLTGELQISTIEDYYGPDIATRAEGDFVVAWTASVSAQNAYDIRARRLDSSGAALGSEIAVNVATAGEQIEADVAMNASGGFVVVWEDRNTGYLGSRMFDGDGLPLADSLNVGGSISGSELPRILTTAGDDFLVAWHGDGETDFDIYARRVSSSGELGDLYLVNEFTSGAQSKVDIAQLADGDFVAVWQDRFRDGSGFGLFGRKLDSSGMPVGSDFAVNGYLTGDQKEASVAALPDGGFMVVWQDHGQEESGADDQAPGLRARRFDAEAVPMADSFQVNTFTQGRQEEPRIVVGDEGTMVVVWEDAGGSDGSFSAVKAQRLALPLFYDGFESGNMTAWSSTSP